MAHPIASPTASAASPPGWQAQDVLQRLLAVARDFGSEHDSQRLLARILDDARGLTQADAGTIYRLNRKRTELSFAIMRTGRLGIALGGPGEPGITLPPIALRQNNGQERHDLVVTHCAFSGETIVIDDAYEAPGFDFSGTRGFDARTGYRSQSFLTVPLKGREGGVIGVLQIINKLDAAGQPIPFTAHDVENVELLAGLAGVAMEKQQLIDDLDELFFVFARVIAAAIDDKSPHTGKHCRKVPELTLLLADAATTSEAPPWRQFGLDARERRELELAAWLHDCGKISTPDWVMEKSTKLFGLRDQIELLLTRVEVWWRDQELKLWRSGRPAAEVETASQALRAEAQELVAFLRRCNDGDTPLPPEAQDRLTELAARVMGETVEGQSPTLFGPNELEKLSIRAGTLTAGERELMNHHVVTSIKMLELLPWPRHLARIPEYAGGHHEKMDGTGYPRGLKGEQMSAPARMMAVADVFEALTAWDRPYKRPKSLAQALGIMRRMAGDHLDPDLFALFVRSGVYQRYAEQYLHPDQIDDINEDELLTGLPAGPAWQEHAGDDDAA